MAAKAKRKPQVPGLRSQVKTATQGLPELDRVIHERARDRQRLRPAMR
jgi:hypothetical protein